MTGALIAIFDPVATIRNGWTCAPGWLEFLKKVSAIAVFHAPGSAPRPLLASRPIAGSVSNVAGTVAPLLSLPIRSTKPAKNWAIAARAAGSA